MKAISSACWGTVIRAEEQDKAIYMEYLLGSQSGTNLQYMLTHTSQPPEEGVLFMSLEQIRKPRH